MVTPRRLLRDLHALGVRPGMDVMVHSSLSKIGHVVGGAEAVVDALLAAVAAGLAPPGASFATIASTVVPDARTRGKYDALYAKQSTTIDEAARRSIIYEMQKMYYDSAAYIVMWYQDKLQAYRTDTWKGWAEIPGGMVYNFTRDNYLKITPVT
jgi:ABC-type transport system substrate-binding protein